MLLYQKTIDRSTLREGFQIPVQFHDLLKALPNGMPSHGEIRNIKIFIDGVAYDAQLKNQSFDQNKYERHADVVQIRYGTNSPFAKKLREIFHVSWNYVVAVKSLPENVNRKFTITIPDELREQILISASNIPDVFVAECITHNDQQDISKAIQSINEYDFEQWEQISKHDDNAHIGYGNSLVRIRHLDRSIGDSLKKLYDYRCQMTGEKIGEEYDALCVEAHHIDSFTKSLNNDYSNIIILSPTYHRIIHKANPTFDRGQMAFCYPNGLVEKVRINKHLE